jgi:hypothetical protein
MKKSCALWIAFGIAVAASDARGSAEQLAGTWKRATSNLTVRVTNWGENCGPAPKSYSNNTVLELEIVSQGRHLVFTKGGLRTDRCSSANPKLVTKSENVAEAQWERVCETPADDSKFEHDEYVFTASGRYRIEYHAKSNYDWSLNGDHCVLSIEERRVFVRSPEDMARDAAKGGDEAAPPEEEAAPSSDSACTRQGDVRRIQIVPKEADVGPGERLCFKAFGFDASGCRFDAEAAWTAEQNRVEARGLMGRNGCFQAGATAAESEGTYAIVAQFEGKRAAAAVTVVFPDYGSLARARLDPSREIDGGVGGTRTASSIVPLPPAPIASAAPASVKAKALVAVISASAVAAAALALALVWFRRRAAARRSLDFDEDPLPSRPSDTASIRCAKCGASFPAGARFCPNDGTILSPLPPQEPPNGAGDDARGMVCPTCNRGYSADARFCPHDSSRLLPYPEWRSLRRRAK